MKKTRKLISLLMALAMIFALSIPAFAAETTGTITIDNAAEGETYSIYKMMELTYNEETESYSYKVLDAWKNFFDAQDGFTVDSQGYVTSTLDSNSSEMATVAKDALTYANENGITATDTKVCDENATSVEFTNLALGYYLVDTSLGTLCSIDSTATDVVIKDKNNDNDDEPGFDKTVNGEQDNTASIGDTLNYSITVSNVDDKSNVKVSDTLSDGLTLNTTSIKVTVNGADVATTNYTLDTTTTPNGFTITFVDSYLEGMTDTIVITYSATINEDAVIGVDGNTNKAILDYGNNQQKDDTAKTYVWDFDLNKVDDSGNRLSDAKFTLKDNNGKVINFVIEDATETEYDNCYRVATASEIEDNSDEVTTAIEAGYVNISGLAAGTYTLTETEAPTGYNLLKDPVTITINANGTVTYGETTGTGVSIVNEAGSELPSTGGMGTTLFYIFGGAMVLCAVVLLVTRRRMDNEQ